jgi:hypothetical protein
MIVARLVEFWSRVTGGQVTLPNSIVIHSTESDCTNEYTLELMFEGKFPLEDRSGTGFLLFHAPPCETMQGDTLLDQVRTLTLNCSIRTKAGLEPERLRLKLLQNLRKLSPSEVKRVPWVSIWEDESIMTPEDWIVDRAQKGRLLKSIDFCECHERARAVFASLSLVQVAQSVTWSMGPFAWPSS